MPRSAELNINCPACNYSFTLSANSVAIKCSSCDQSYLSKDGVVDLRLGQPLDTLLDIDSYDSDHGVSGEAASVALWRYYEKILNEMGVNLSGCALEIASGSGHLSLGLVGHSNFELVALSDISPDFINLLLSKLRNIPSAQKGSFIPFLFDANNIPFSEDQFDLIVGNSVLHHFKTFENTLAEAFKILKRGGCAVFGEPVMDTHVFMSLAAKLIAEFCKTTDAHSLSQYDRMILEAASDICNQKMVNLRSDRSQLSEIEDKFVFPVEYMRDLSETIGYEKFLCVTPEVINLSFSIKQLLSIIFEQQKIDVSKLDQFDFIFNSIGSVYGSVMKESIKAPFSFFVFVKG